MAENNLISVTTFALALCDGAIDTIHKFLTQQERASATDTTVTGSIATAFLSSAATFTDDLILLLQWFYGRRGHHHRHGPVPSLQPLTQPLAFALSFLLLRTSKKFNVEAVEILLSSWVFSDHLTETQQSSVMTKCMAAACGDTAMLELLLAHGGACPPLSLGIRNSACFRFLLCNGAPIVGDPLALNAAIDSGCSIEFVRELITMGADPSDCLHRAIVQGKWRVMDLLASEAVVDMNRFPCLVQAAIGQSCISKSERFEAVERLLGFGVDVNARGWKNSTALTAASVLKDQELVRLLLEHGAEPNCGGASCSILFFFCDLRVTAMYYDSIQALVTAGANVNWQDAKGQTPLHRLTFRGAQGGKTSEAIKLLIQAGGDVDLENKAGQTPLTLLSRSNPELLEELRAMGLVARC